MPEIITKKGQIIIVDQEDYKRFNKRKWKTNENGYVVRYAMTKGVKHVLRLHREIMRAPKGMDVDHIDGNKLNNSKSNLRICTRSENLSNQIGKSNRKSKYKGVQFIRNRWVAHICSNYVIHFLGSYKSEELAAIAYNQAAIRFHGTYAQLNEAGLWHSQSV